MPLKYQILCSANWLLPAGSGKTVLWFDLLLRFCSELICFFSSTIIEDVAMLCRGQRGAMLIYFYFSRRSYEEQHYEWLIRSLTSQILAECEVVPEALRDHFRECERQQPGVGKLVSIMPQVLGEYNTSYVILDALDECADPEDVTKLILTLMNRKIPGLHILITGRKAKSVLTSLCTDIISIEAELIELDILLFIQDSLRNRPGMRKWPPEVKAEIEETLVTRAEGKYVIWSKSTRLVHGADMLATVLFTSLSS